MHKPSLTLLCLLTLIGLSAPCAAEEIWVKNKPFTGQVQRSGEQTLVELYPFAKAAEIELEVRGETLRFGQFTIPIQTMPDGAKMVSLQDLAGVVGLKIRKNPRLGTLDVHAASVGTGHRGDWSQVGHKNPSSDQGTLLREFNCETYIVRVPAGLKMFVEPRTLLKDGKLDPEAIAARSSSEAEFVMADKLKPQSGAFTLTLVYQPTADFDDDFIAKTLETTKAMLAKDGGVFEGSPQIVNLSGRKFHKQKGTVVLSSGKKRFENYLHFSKKHKTIYFVQVIAPESEANKFFPRLRRALQKFRVK